MKAADRCPGLLRAHRAEDGLLVRLRFPGGQTRAGVMVGLSRLAAEFGHPELQLTSRAGLQLRGLPDPVPAALITAIERLGLVPSPAHERVRNIVASPLTGLSGGRADLRGLIAELDRRLLAQPELAGLPGRFLFVLDDGRGDVAHRQFDVGYRALDARSGLVLVGGADLGAPIRADHAVETMLDLARAFVAVRNTSGAWHVRDLPEWRFGLPGLGPVGTLPAAGAVPLGAVGRAASVSVPLGRLSPAQAQAVARTASGPVVLTPWRGLVVPGAAARLPELLHAGLVADPRSPWSLITACVGAPGCAQAAASTRDRALELVAAGHVQARTHVSGCARRCGAPDGPYADVLLGHGRSRTAPSWALP